MTDGQRVRVDRGHRARVITLEREPNLFDDVFLDEFHRALDAVEADGTGDPVVTIGTGKFFSNGFDLEYLGGRGDDLWPFVGRACRLVARVLTFPAPTVAAINGHAFGIGAILALAHDQRVMRDDRGWWCLPEVDLGLAFHPFMQALLLARLPERTANEAILTGRRYDGTAARAAGIAGATASDADLLDTAVACTASWTGKQPEVVGRLKAQLHAAVTAALDAP
jgi:enoyl-CoA hydratase/carnithine racemase